MSKKKTHEEYVAELAIKNPNVKVIGKYIGANIPIEHYCVCHNIHWNIAPHNALQGKGCRECKKEKESVSKRKTHKKYIEEMQICNPHIEVLEKYIDSKTPILHRCTIHNVSWNISPDSVLQCGGCNKCHYEKIKNALRKTHYEYVNDVLIANKNVKVIGQYINAKTPILHYCKVHKVQWMAQPCHILEGHGCPQCNESHGEKLICQWLTDHEIAYIPQKTFDGCKNKRALPFDFYVPTLNLCIEYDGEQHFRPVDYFGGSDGFKQRQHNDAIKTKYCEDHNIYLLRIPYFKNVEEELNNFYSFNIVTSMAV